ncbi:MAG: methyltransferase [Candidatus Aminicenantes bacterium]|nr:methyltransferase [Candidatus Aminicenantes bacterium]
MSHHQRPLLANRENEPITSPAQLRAAVYGFRRSRIILTAFELGLFSKLADKSMSSEQLAKIIGADARATDRLLNALCVLGLVKKNKGEFVNTKIARDFLVAGEPQFLAGLAHSSNQWQTWHTLSAAVRRGTSVIDRKSGSGSKRLQGFIAAMHERATPQAPEIVKLLDLTKVNRCLDIGSGSGAYAMALARAKKSISVAAFDLPEVLSLTRQYVARAGLLPRFDFLAGDFHRGGWGKGYDLVLLSAIVHMNRPAENRRLIARAAASLNPGGQLVIQDFVMDPGRTRPATGAFFALNMLVATRAGDTFTARELGGWMRDAGLKKIVRRQTPFDASLLIGRKP